MAEIASTYASDLYQNSFEGFSLESIEYNEVLNYYAIRFVKYYGKTALNIIGPVVNINIYPDGTINACITSDLYDFDAFNEDALTGLTQQTISAFAEKNVQAIYEDCEAFNVKTIYLEKSQENFILNVHVEVKLPSGENALEVFPYSYFET